VKVPESLNEWKDSNGVKHSAGLVVIQDNRILLVHPTNSPWWGTYSIPKGEIDKNEDPLEAAIRETQEETGIKIKKEDIDTRFNNIIEYRDNQGELYKKVHYFVAFPKKLIEKENLKPQYKEVDWIGFVSKKEAQKRIFGRFKSLLIFLD
jgi:8-oxo-dGTP diphosphatase